MRFTIPQAGILSIAVAALAACATGHDGDVNFGGQDPDPVVLDIPIAYVKGPVPAPVDLAAIDARELDTVQ